MNNRQDLLIDLDLNLISDPKLLEEEYASINLKTRSILLDQTYWQRTLMTWINFIRSNTSFKCYKSVRRSFCWSMGLQFTDDITIKEINSKWRQKEETTDVLSFPVLDERINLPKDEPVELGDIVISIQTANSQALKFNHGLVMELRWLVSHGLLHLLGWEHQNHSQLEAMLICQERLLSLDPNVQTQFGMSVDKS